MKKYSLILFLFLVFSCQYFEKQIPSEATLLSKEIEAIDWKTVDEFPSVAGCDSVSNKLIRQQCFTETVIKLIQERLDLESTTILEPKEDTIQVSLTILPNSSLIFETKKESIPSENAKKLDSILNAKMIDFPEIKPAIKRGIPVKVTFNLPVVIKKV